MQFAEKVGSPGPDHPLPLLPASADEESQLGREFAGTLRGLNSGPSSIDNRTNFEVTHSVLLQQAVEILHLPPRTNRQSQASPSPTKAFYNQRLYCANRKRAVHLIHQGDQSGRYKASSQVIYDYFASAWPSKTQYETYLSNNGCPVLNFQPFLPAEVNRKLVAAESTASGYDRITYAHWWQLDLDCVLTTVILNACIHHHKIPKDWNTLPQFSFPKLDVTLLSLKLFNQYHYALHSISF